MASARVNTAKMTSSNTGMTSSYHAGDVPVDRGWAWLVLIGCTMPAFFVMGGVKAAGVLMPALEEHYDCTSTESIGVFVIMSGVFAVFSVVANALGAIFSHRTVMLIGGILLAFSSIATAHAQNIHVVMVTLGLLTGVSYAFLSAPGVVILNAYFVERESVANGLCLGLAGLGQLIMPLLTNHALNYQPFTVYCYVFGAICLNCLPAALLLRPTSFYTKHRNDHLDYPIPQHKSISSPPSSRIPIVSITQDSMASFRSRASSKQRKYIKKSSQDLSQSIKSDSRGSLDARSEASSTKGSDQSLRVNQQQQQPHLQPPAENRGILQRQYAFSLSSSSAGSDVIMPESPVGNGAVLRQCSLESPLSSKMFAPKLSKVWEEPLLGNGHPEKSMSDVFLDYDVTDGENQAGDKGSRENDAVPMREKTGASATEPDQRVTMKYNPNTDTLEMTVHDSPDGAMDIEYTEAEDTRQCCTAFKEEMFDKDLLTQSAFIAYLVGVGLGHAGISTGCFFINKYVLELRKDDLNMGPKLVAIIGLTDVVGRLGGGAIAQIISQKSTRKRIVYLTVCLLMVTGMFSFVVGPFPYDWVLYTYAVINGLLGGAYRAFLPIIIMDYFGKEKLGTAIGMAYGVKGLFATFIPLIAGLLTTKDKSRHSLLDYSHLYHGFGLITVVAAMLLALVPALSRTPTQRALSRGYMEQQGSVRFSRATPFPSMSVRNRSDWMEILRSQSRKGRRVTERLERGSSFFLGSESVRSMSAFDFSM